VAARYFIDNQPVIDPACTRTQVCPLATVVDPSDVTCVPVASVEMIPLDVVGDCRMFTRVVVR
jgi:hypothetical protein